MTVNRDILAFLRETGAFARGVSPADAALHAASLTTIVEPTITRAMDNSLRPAQVKAFEGLSHLRAGLVLGPPGTGKTHLLSWLVLGHVGARAAAGLGSRVFLTAFTRSAIETLVDGIAKRAAVGPCEAPIVYLGRPRSPLPDNVRCVESVYRGADEIRTLLQLPNVVVAGTIWGLQSAIAAGCLPLADGPTAPFFDLVAIDEASQMVLGQGLMALAGMADGCRVVVAGDDRQLPPIRSARGMEIDGRQVGGSLYAFLKAGGVPEFALDETFRLNEPLTAFPEKRFYPGIYTSAVADRRLTLAPDWRDGLDDLERIVLDPMFPTVVLVHDGPSAATQSPFEVELAARIAMRFRARVRTSSGAVYGSSKFWREGMALISPHRAQNAALRARLDAADRSEAFVDTVDRIQGRERDVVVMTYTVSDAEFALAEAEFIFSPERLNVAVTRARSKLVVIVSRRLLEVIPPQQEVLDKPEVLREFVFAAPAVGDHVVRLAGLPPTRVTIRAQGFRHHEDVGEGAPAAPAPVGAAADLDPRSQAVLDEIRRLCVEEGTDSVSLLLLRKRISHRDGLQGTYAEARTLHAGGWASLAGWPDKYKPGEVYWRVSPLEHRTTVAHLDDPTVRDRIADAVYRDNLPYYQVREGFAWMSPAWPGEDLLRPIVDDMVMGGKIRASTSAKGIALLSPAADDGPAEEADASFPMLEDADFRVLNALEDLEITRIDAGLVEVWSDVNDLARRGWAEADASAAMTRLAANGHVMLAADGRIRSRMAELAREIRYVKQRFREDDAGRRPYLVRSLKVLVRDRVKPRQDLPLHDVLGRAKARHADPDVDRAIDGMGVALASLWGAAPRLAGFQARSFDAILSSWLGSASDDSFVVAADTGSGKTEAAVLPMIAGACVDALRGIDGTRAILAYPRVRLASNQSQRLARYLSAMAGSRGMPTLTLGAQFADVPTSWRMGTEQAATAEKSGWIKAGDVWRFPLFACPVPTCASPLDLQPGMGVAGADRLRCPRCSWHFNGWIGTKDGLIARPPTFFLPTMDSLHQWLQTPRYGKLFGDSASSAPRAFLADEIHLYAYTHGAQVAYAIRRTLARSERNDPSRRKCLAIGMSATLGNPGQAFARLVGRSDVSLVAPEDHETPVNPRGREYFYFIQPEVESRDKDVAGASTTIQSLMCLAHGMRRRRGQGGGFRAVAFLDSIDKVRRLHSSYDDAERDNNVASLRTSRFGEDAVAGRHRGSCCGDPATCERFVDGECWYFAATDRRQARADGRSWRPGRPLSVVRSPVSSGTEGVIERMIKDSDVVFATSSLEVGYDDPDISLVYQHYGPQNLASFVQRKGRAGRGADDRPITAVTLSVYKPRDTYWFNRPELMLDAKGYEAPLNPSNHFVRRSQILSQFLDGLAAFEARTNQSPWRGHGDILPEAAEEAGSFVETVFGREPWRAYGSPRMVDLWSDAVDASQGENGLSSARDARRLMPWLPEFLHDTIDLPSLKVIVPGTTREADTDIQLAFAMLAPGNITRRFDRVIGAWRPPRAGLAPWLADDDYAQSETFAPCGPTSESLLAELPLSARAALGPLIDPFVLRPRRATLEKAGTFSAQGSSWEPAFRIDDGGAVRPVDAAATAPTLVGHESTGSIEGCMIVEVGADAGLTSEPPAGAHGVAALRVFASDARRGGSGLTVAYVAWGAEAVLRTTVPGVDPLIVNQTFCDPKTGKLTLHGYQVETEGVQIILDEARVAAFVEREVAHATAGMAAWHRMHMARAEVALRLAAVGLNRFDAERIGALVGSIVVLPAFEERVAKLKRFSSVKAICDMLEDVRRDHHSFDPMLTVPRVDRAVAQVRDGSTGKVIQEVFRALDDDDAKGRYLRSCLLHGLSLRWRQLFVTLAQGDERRVSVHCKLPILYGDTPAVITVAETGQAGDGTTRAFKDKIDEAWTRWSDGFPSSCANADEDAVVDRFLTDGTRHEEWLSMNPRDERALGAMAAALRNDGTSGVVPASVTRILFGHQVVGQEQFRVYDLAAAIYGARGDLEGRLGRPSLPWELVSCVTAQAAVGEGPAVLIRLFQAYGAIPEADGEGSRSAATRFAEQVFRLGTRLCTDGCRACVHQDSGLAHGMLAEATVSRTLIRSYLTCD